ncbi:hypothetical protein [Flavobacterium ginsengiterrae]|uniref:Uncharacterized protein n=1 Tax=Flavobacterium ginsengiterrae TaxID=871695 RepID=A0ABP7GX07_9FLAO
MLNLINQYRKNQDNSLLHDFECKHNGKTEYGHSFDENYWSRNDLIFELYNNYNIEDKKLIKWLLQEQIKGIEFDIPVYALDVCAFMLYKLMENEDIYDLYLAKFGTGTDAQFFVDIELIFGFDKEQTKEYLKNQKKNKRLNNKIIKIINYYESHPNGKYRNRKDYINYFETKKIEIIKSDLEEYLNTTGRD